MRLLMHDTDSPAARHAAAGLYEAGHELVSGEGAREFGVDAAMSVSVHSATQPVAWTVLRKQSRVATSALRRALAATGTEPGRARVEVRRNDDRLAVELQLSPRLQDSPAIGRAAVLVLASLYDLESDVKTVRLSASRLALAA
jgi:hypothetical protein